MIDQTAKEKIFEADLSNIVRKVKAGKPLSGAERKIIDQESAKAPSNTLPTYDSLAACSGATGIPLQVLKQSKRAGCSAFHSNRVYLKVFLQWYFTQDNPDANENWANRCKRADALAKEFKLARNKELYMETSDVCEKFMSYGEYSRQILLQKLVNEYPAQVANMDMHAIRAFGRKLFDEIMILERDFCAQWSKPTKKKK